MPRQRRGWAMQGGEQFQRRHSPVTTSLLEPILLFSLKVSHSHGYNLLNDLREIGLGSIHPSMVYRTLREMEDLKWVISEWDISQPQGPPRRTYHITPLGEEAIENWKDELSRINQLIATLLNMSEK